MSEQDKKDIQSAKQSVLAAIDLVEKISIGGVDAASVCRWCGDAVRLLDDVEERNQ